MMDIIVYGNSPTLDFLSDLANALYAGTGLATAYGLITVDDAGNDRDSTFNISITKVAGKLLVYGSVTASTQYNLSKVKLMASNGKVYFIASPSSGGGAVSMGTKINIYFYVTVTASGSISYGSVGGSVAPVNIADYVYDVLMGSRPVSDLAFDGVFFDFRDANNTPIGVTVPPSKTKSGNTINFSASAVPNANWSLTNIGVLKGQTVLWMYSLSQAVTGSAGSTVSISASISLGAL
jgi:hypothetical protein